MYSDPPQAMLFRLPGQFDGTHIHKPVKEDKSDLSCVLSKAFLLQRGGLEGRHPKPS